MGKDFPSYEFVQATMGRNLSYVWRSIMAAQEVVKRGIRWQVGNGQKIQIWKDRWLPSPSQYKVISPPSLLHHEARVNELIDVANGEWRSELVVSVFLPSEAETICGIALSAAMPEDRQIWAPTANGRFSVRSAYKLAMEAAYGRTEHRPQMTAK